MHFSFPTVNPWIPAYSLWLMLRKDAGMTVFLVIWSLVISAHLLIAVIRGIAIQEAIAIRKITPSSIGVDCLKYSQERKNSLGNNKEQYRSHNWQIKAVEPMVRNLPEK